MRCPVTFYRNLDHDAGVTYELPISGELPVQPIQVYTTRPVNWAGVKNQRVDHENQLVARLNDMTGELANQKSGGILVATLGSGKDQRVWIKCYGLGDGPRNLAVVRPGRRLVELEINEFALDKDRRLPAGAHLIVPVDAGATTRLQALIEELAWLSADLERVLAYTLHSPDLEARIARLEKRVLGSLEEVPRPKRKGLMVRQVSRWFGAKPLWLRRAAVGLVAIVAGVLLAYLGRELLTLVSSFPRREQRSDPPAAAVGKSSELPEDKNGKFSSGSSVATPVSAMNEFLGVFEGLANADSNSDFAKLWQSRFAGQQVIAQHSEWANDAQVSTALATMPIAWGTIQAAILGEGFQFGDEAAALTEERPWTSTKQVLRNGVLTRMPDVTKFLLAVVACKGGTQSGFSGPGIVATRAQGSLGEPLELLPGVKCEDVPLTKAVPGLQLLTAKLKGRLDRQ